MMHLIGMTCVCACARPHPADAACTQLHRRHLVCTRTKDPPSIGQRSHPSCPLPHVQRVSTATQPFVDEAYLVQKYPHSRGCSTAAGVRLRSVSKCVPGAGHSAAVVDGAMAGAQRIARPTDCKPSTPEPQTAQNAAQGTYMLHSAPKGGSHEGAAACPAHAAEHLSAAPHTHTHTLPGCCPMQHLRPLPSITSNSPQRASSGNVRGSIELVPPSGSL